MYYNGKELKNLQEYTEARLGRAVYREYNYSEFRDVVLDYYSSMGEFSQEDLRFILDIDQNLRIDLQYYVPHWELQQFEEPGGEMTTCNTYYNWDEALEDFEEAIKEGGYWDLVPVDQDGMPIDESPDYRTNY